MDIKFYEEIASNILGRVEFRPKVAIVLGSALGGIADEIEDAVVIDYDDVPNFLVSTVASHAGKMIFGRLNGVEVLCLSGRFHYYEGYSFEELSLPVRVLKLIGIESLILTNAAGAIDDSFSVGDIMIITDHLNIYGVSPTRGENISELGPRFFDTSDMYSKTLIELARTSAKKLDMELREGVYAFAVGPNFETPAEIRGFKVLGGNAVGMSTVTESITAAHVGIDVLGLSLITNMAAGILNQPITVEEVGETGLSAQEKFKALIREIIKNI